MTPMTPSSTPSSPPTSSSSGEPLAAADTDAVLGDDREAILAAATAATLDLTGEVCPYTFVRTRLALEELPLGALLIVEGDHPPARVNVPRSARAWGQEVVTVDDASTGRWRVVLRKLVA
jgi:tRNA 2-thiouridine synthesizing protein A